MAEIVSFRRFVPPNQPPDWQARQQALDIRRSWIVEAPAGSGKTGLLIQRYLKLLADESVTDPAQVLAITFTVKATAELRERVLTQLQQAADDVEPANAFDLETRPLAMAALARDRELGWNLAENPGRLAIRTITSVSAGIAASLPVLSGSGGGAAITTQDARLHEAAARRTLMQLGGEDRELTAAIETLLLHRDGNLANCEALLAGMLPWRDQWGELVPLHATDLDDAFLEAVILPRIEQGLELAICRTLTRVAAHMPADALHQLATLANAMSYLPGYKGAESPLAICRELTSAPGQAAQDLAHWRALANLLITASSKDWRGGFNKNQVMFEIEPHQRTELKALVERLRHHDDLRACLCDLLNLPPAQYPREQWVVTKALFRVLSRTLIELQLVFAEQGACDFVEVDLLAKSALAQGSASDDLIAANGYRLQHLLVDEMQDTSSSQYELIQLLTQSWDGQSQTVFLVGDPKQSIYLFRQARVERFLRTMASGRLGEIELGWLQLTANFRSQAGLVESFNDTFRLLFPSEMDMGRPEQVAYVEAAAMRPTGGQHNTVWHTEAVGFYAEDADRAAAKKERARSDAVEIRQIVEHWRATPLPAGRSRPWEIAVLVRARSHLREIVAALKQPDRHGRTIPIHAVAIDPLGERQEILDLIALTRALLHPADRVAWFALLRAPWCGLTLADLHRLAGADDETFEYLSVPRLMEERGEDISADGRTRLVRVRQVMQAARAARGRSTVAQWVEETWRGLGGDLYLTAEQRANAQQYLRLLDQAEEPGGVVSIERLEGWLEDLYAETPKVEGAVELMTIHKAKGLEWDVVIVPGMERVGRYQQGRLLNWLEIEGDTGAAHGILAPIQSRGGASKQLNDWMRGIESAREAAERKRLFYVACTRAREELHLFAAPLTKQKGDYSVPANSLLFAAWPAAQHHVYPALQPVADEVGGGFELALAASAEPLAAVSPRTALMRLPLDQVTTLPAATRVSVPGLVHFDRPEGSFEARSFGNVVHWFFDLASSHLAEGGTLEELLGTIATWRPRVSAALRSSGLAGAKVDRLATRVLLAIANALRDPHGVWILGPHPTAASEAALVSWQAEREGIRLDRTFLAGDQPFTEGDAVRWIIDYKTTAHGAEGMEAFLDAEKERYRGQLEEYARLFAQEKRPIRVGLYYPLLPGFVWWEPALS